MILDQIVFNFGHVPAKKNNRDFAKTENGGFTKPNERHKSWHSDMQEYHHPKIRPLPSPVSIAARYWPGSFKIFDMSNQQESIHDWLVDMGVIKDDNVFELQSYTCELAGLIRGRARVEITVTSFAQSPSQIAMNLLRDKVAMRAHLLKLRESGQKVKLKDETERLWEALRDFQAFDDDPHCSKLA